MRKNLLKSISEQKDVTNAIILTHNIDFVFLQSVVLSILRGCGNPALTIFADANCAADTYKYQSQVLESIGVRYRVVPVAMEPGFRFHPKAVLLSAPEKAILFIGSGNLTFGGWRENAEIWVSYDSDADGTGVFSAFYSYLKDIISRVPLRESIHSEIDTAFDGSLHNWALELNEPSGLIGKAGKGDSLIDQIVAIIGEESFEQLNVCAPYFDTDAEALQNILKELPVNHSEVFIQNGKSNLLKSAASKLPENVKLIPVQFFHKNDKEDLRQTFVHAKFYAFIKENRVTLFSGSANCSRAALTIPGKNGNAELMAIQTISLDDFQKQYLDELVISENALELLESDEKAEMQNLEHYGIRILAARFESGELLLGYICPADTKVTHCIINENAIEVELLNENTATVQIENPPSSVHLEGINNGNLIRSNLIWVDHENELRSTSRSRSFAQKIRDNVKRDIWDIGAWTELVDIFNKHLIFMPKRTRLLQRSKNKEKKGDEILKYSESDVFSKSYGLPSFGGIQRSSNQGDNIQSLQQLLIRWFGISYNDDEDIDSDSNDNFEENGDEETVDRPEKLPPTRKKPRKPNKIAKKTMNEAKKAIGEITVTMTSSDYLENREPEMLAADIKVASILFRVGLSEGWTTYSDFFENTWQIWSSLFFTSSSDSTKGWIELRYKNDESPNEFVARMSSVEISAALAAWALAIPAAVKSPEHAQFALACILSMARLPWLWQGGDNNKIASELGKILNNTRKSKEKGLENWAEIENQWLNIIRRGHALGRLEKAMKDKTPAELRENIRQDEIKFGELLWQGRSGFCVATKSCKREDGQIVPALHLQGKSAETSFKAEFTIPLRALLDDQITPPTENFGDKERKEIYNFIESIYNGFIEKEQEESQNLFEL